MWENSWKFYDIPEDMTGFEDVEMEGEDSRDNMWENSWKFYDIPEDMTGFEDVEMEGNVSILVEVKESQNDKW